MRRPVSQVNESPPESMRSAIFDPLIDYFSRKDALWILAFIFFYKLGDQMALFITTPFYLDIGFSKTQIGTVVKFFGFWPIVFGGLAGGVMMLRLGIARSLWVFGILQAVSILGFVVLARVGYSLPLLAGVVVFENLGVGMGTAAFLAYMASITNKKYTATQYALLSCLMGVPPGRLLRPRPDSWRNTWDGRGFSWSARHWPFRGYFFFSNVRPGIQRYPHRSNNFPCRAYYYQL